MGERCNRTAEVRGSNPLSSTRPALGGKNSHLNPLFDWGLPRPRVSRGPWLGPPPAPLRQSPLARGPPVLIGAFDCPSRHPSNECRDDHLNPPNTPRWLSATVARTPASGRRPDLSATPTTTRCARACWLRRPTGRTLERELLDRHRFRSHSKAKMAVFHFIEGFQNPSRRHSALGYVSPVEYERKHDELT